jgi:hypothetical protein
MNIILLISISIMGILVASLMAGDTVRGQEFINYTDPEGEFTLIHPSNWTLVTDQDIISSFDPELADFAGILVDLAKVRGPHITSWSLKDKVTNESIVSADVQVREESELLKTLEDVRAHHITQMTTPDEDITNFYGKEPKVLNSTYTTLSGQRAFTIHLINAPGDEVLKITTFDPSLHKSYTMGLYSHPIFFNEYLSTFLRMADSFHVTS